MISIPFIDVRVRTLACNATHTLPTGAPQGAEGMPAQHPLHHFVQNRATVTRDRNLDGLNAILEVLEAAELERDQDGEQGLLGEHVVCGLLIAARQLSAAITAPDRECNAVPALP